MIKPLFQKLYSHRDQFLRYFVIGTSGFVIDLSTLALFIDIFKWSAVVSLMINQFIVLGYIFYLNKKWAFQSVGKTGGEVRRYLTLYFFNYLFAIAWMYVWHDMYGFEPKLVRIANVIFSTSWNFFLYKYFVYRIDDSNKKSPQ